MKPYQIRIFYYISETLNCILKTSFPRAKDKLHVRTGNDSESWTVQESFLKEPWAKYKVLLDVSREAFVIMMAAGTSFTIFHNDTQVASLQWLSRKHKKAYNRQNLFEIYF